MSFRFRATTEHWDTAHRIFDILPKDVDLERVPDVVALGRVLAERAVKLDVTAYRSLKALTQSSRQFHGQRTFELLRHIAREQKVKLQRDTAHATFFRRLVAHAG